MDLKNLNKDKKYKRRESVNLDTMVYGKVPPQDKEAERAILGAIMLERGALAEIGDLLTPEKFYLESHQHMYRAMISLDRRSEPIESLTVVMELRRMEVLEKVGGPFYVTGCMNAVVSSANIVTHARKVVEYWMAREVIRVGGEMVGRGYEDSQDPFDLLDFAEREITGIMDSNDRGKITPVAEAAAKSLHRLAVLRAANSSLTGVPAGYCSLDNLTHGWQDTDLIVLAARPSVGKTAFALNLIANAAMAEKRTPVAFFSLEMSISQVMERMIARESGIFLDRIKTGQLSESEMTAIHQATARIAEAPIFLDDTPALNLFELRAKCRRLKNKQRIGLIIIDYLQLMSGSGEKGNREQEISHISRDLKGLAKELQVPIIALSQLSRAVENRNDKTPQLSDLRECIAADEWIYTDCGPVKIGDRPKSVITLSNEGTVSGPCEFVPKKFNTVYHIRTQYGQVRATANHLILTGTGWKKIRDLETNRDVIASAKRIPHANKGFQPHARFLGWMIGNGGLSGTPSLIYRRELDAVVKNEVEKLGVRVQYRKTQKSHNVFDAYLSNGIESGSLPNPVMLWLRGLGLEGRDCYTKFIPAAFMGSSDETHRELLRGLWEADGTVTGGVAKYGTVSEMLARQIGWLLLTIGVRSTVNMYDGLWEVRCSKADNETMRDIVNNAERFGVLDAPDEDYMDPAPSIFVELAAELSQDNIIRFQKKASGEYKSVSKPRMSVLLESFPIPSIEKSPYMSLPDTGWGRIYSIEKEEQEVRVCDLAVPFTHNFVANGIVVHNSGAIEQDADMVMFLYRPEYYGIISDENGANVAGETHVKIAKHRNGSLDTVKLRALLHIQKFVEMDMAEAPPLPRSSWRPVQIPYKDETAF